MVFFELFVPAVGVFLFAIFLLIVINLFYRFLIKQDEAKKIKDRINEINSELKKYRSDKEKSSQLLKEMMTENSKIMRMTLRPMLVSFLVVILFLPFLGTVYSDRYAVLPNNVTGNVTLDSTYFDLQKTDSGLVIKNSTSSYECSLPCREQINTSIPSKWNISQEGERIKFGRITAMLPFSLPFVDDDAGWILWYLLISIPMMVIIRKMMGINV